MILLYCNIHYNNIIIVSYSLAFALHLFAVKIILLISYVMSTDFNIIIYFIVNDQLVYSALTTISYPTRSLLIIIIIIRAA